MFFRRAVFSLVVVAACHCAPARTACPQTAAPTAVAQAAAASSAATATAPVSVAALGGPWIGGFTDVPFLQVEFQKDRAFDSADDEKGQPLANASLEGDRVRFEAVLDGSLVAFDGRGTADDVIEGEVRRDRALGRFRLVRLGAYDRARFEREAAGTYVSAQTTFLLSARSATARLFDATTGAVHMCLPRADGTYAIGPGLASAYPQAGTLRLERDASGRVGAIHVAMADGSAEEVAQRADPRSADVAIAASEGATLAGTVYLPDGAGPFPGVVFVHGSGKITREDWWQQAMARVYLREGVAVLLYDKRGTGRSTGTYVGPGAGPGVADQDNTAPRNLQRLADDARAAVSALASRPEIDRKRVGLTGISQAGWIMPLAASQSRDVAFLVSFSGPAVTTYIEDVHSRLLGDGESSPTLTLADVDEIERAMPKTPPKTWRGGDPGFDPAPYLARLAVPALFVYGALDSSIPAAESVRILDKLRAGHAWDVKTLPDAGHPLYEVKRDTEADDLRTTTMQRELLPTVRTWLRAHVLSPR